MQLKQTVPADGQYGNLWAPVCPGSMIPAAGGIVTVGVHPQSHLNKRILTEVFGFENVVNGSGFHALSLLNPDTAVVIGRDNSDVPGLRQFLGIIGRCNIVLDIQTFARMSSMDGFDLHAVRIEVSAADPLHVFQHRMDADVFPAAPVVRVENAEILSCGFSDEDRFHLFNRCGDNLILHVLADGDKLRSLSKELPVPCHVWASSVPAKEPAVLVIETLAGGRVIVFDLDTVNRPPEKSGAENLPVHLLLSALGITRVTFGKFLTAFRRYEDMVEGVDKLHRQYPGFTRLDTVGHSLEGREMRLLTVALDFNAPPVLFTTGIHPLEWAPAYGVSRFLMHLLRQCSTGTDYARLMLEGKKLQWLISACPDGWETRDLAPPGLDLNRNLPGSWERCIAGETYWDAYNRKYSTTGEDHQLARGSAPGSQPETRVMMKLLDGRTSGLADFHETTAFESFFHQPEMDGGTIPDLNRHLRLISAMSSQFNGRFYANGNTVAFRPALNDFSTYSFREQRHADRLIPGPHCGWLMYAAAKGIPAILVEAAGADCTHYQTIRRTEYTATAAELILGSDEGAFLRNPSAVQKECTVSTMGMKRPLDVCVCDGSGVLSKRWTHTAEGDPVEHLPPDGTMFVRHS